MRTIFNVLGPLTNPAGASAQVVGVYDPELVPVLASALARMSVERALVVHGSGLDEIAIHGPTTVAEVTGSDIEEYTLTPEEIGIERSPVETVSGGTPTENAEVLRGIVSGDIEGPKRDIVLANAGAAIYVAGEEDSIESGAAQARAAIESGAARATLDDVTSVTITK